MGHLFASGQTLSGLVHSPEGSAWSLEEAESVQSSGDGSAMESDSLALILGETSLRLSNHG